MTHEEHKARHVVLHAALDELFADYIQHHGKEHRFLQMPFEKLLTWSFKETLNPTEYPAPGGVEHPRAV